jgi:hypothetical protein
MNTSPVHFILFPADNESTQRETKVDTLRLRMLAYFIGGIGGTQQSRSLAWLFHNEKYLWPGITKEATTNWTLQLLDVCACGNRANISGYTVDKRNIINALTKTTLFIVFKLAEAHETWKIHHLQLLGVPLTGLGTIPTVPTTSCLLCDTTWRHLYRIEVNNTQAPSVHKELLKHILIRESLKRNTARGSHIDDSVIIQQCHITWNTILSHHLRDRPCTSNVTNEPLQHEPSEKRTSQNQEALARVLYKWDACVCLVCAAPILTAIHQSSTAEQAESQPISSRSTNKSFQPVSARSTNTDRQQLPSTSVSTSSETQKTGPYNPSNRDSHRLRSRSSSSSKETVAVNYSSNPCPWTKCTWQKLTKVAKGSQMFHSPPLVRALKATKTETTAHISPTTLDKLNNLSDHIGQT